MIEKTHIDKINQLIISIEKGEDVSAHFSQYLSGLCGISDQSYSASKWPQEWRKAVYRLGTIFLKKDAGPYIKILSDYLVAGKECEIAAFINSEIIWNYYESTSEYHKDILRSYIQLFPHNPEFHNNYGIFLASNCNFDKSLDEHKIAIKLDNDNGNLINNYFLAVKQYFEHSLKSKNVDKAEKIIKDTEDFLKTTSFKGMGRWEIETKLSSLRDRLNDFQIILDRISFFEGDMEAKIRGEQKRLIEILGIFSAITAFILTNITIVLASLTIVEALILMFAMALVLIIFALIISLLFSPKRKYREKFSTLKDGRLWAIVILMIILLASTGWCFSNLNKFTKESTLRNGVNHHLSYFLVV